MSIANFNTITRTRYLMMYVQKEGLSKNSLRPSFAQRDYLARRAAAA